MTQFLVIFGTWVFFGVEVKPAERFRLYKKIPLDMELIKKNK